MIPAASISKHSTLCSLPHLSRVAASRMTLFPDAMVGCRRVSLVEMTVSVVSVARRQGYSWYKRPLQLRADRKAYIACHLQRRDRDTLRPSPGFAGASPWAWSA